MHGMHPTGGDVKRRKARYALIALWGFEARLYKSDTSGARCERIAVSLKSTCPNGGSPPLI